MERLKGKTAMVVGAGSIGPGWGNGKATAVTFAREGAQVFCVDRNGKAAQETVDIITGEGCKAAAFTTLNTAVPIPMATPRPATAITTTVGLRRKSRAA